MDFSTFLSNQAGHRPDAVALYDAGQASSYAQLLQESGRVAGLLHEQGARAGDRLALWMPTCHAWLALFMACMRLGVTVVAVNTRYKSHEVEHLLARSRSRWLALWPGFKDLPFAQTLSQIPAASLKALEGIVVYGDEGPAELVKGARRIAYAATARHPWVPSTQDLSALPAVVYTTSGTTSAPKLVVHDQGSLLAHAADVARFFGIGPGDAVFQGVPLCGTFGLTSALATLVAGAAIVAVPSLTPVDCAVQFRQHAVTHTFMNNELFARILDQVKGDTHPFPDLRMVGFASFSPSLGGLPQRATGLGVKMVGLYGSSELQALMAGRRPEDPLEERQKPGGQFVSAAAEVRARDPESGALLPDGAVGELEIRAPSLMKGYMDDEAATRRVLGADGFFRTGDLGYTEGPHQFVFSARQGDYLRLSGFLVNPLEIEDFIQSIEGVAKCQVVGVEQGGKSVAVAFVVLQDGASVSEDRVLESCKARMAKFKVPARVCFIDAFPVVEGANSTKIKKNELQEQARRLFV